MEIGAQRPGDCFPQPRPRRKPTAAPHQLAHEKAERVDMVPASGAGRLPQRRSRQRTAHPLPQATRGIRLRPRHRGEPGAMKQDLPRRHRLPAGRGKRGPQRATGASSPIPPSRARRRRAAVSIPLPAEKTVTSVSRCQGGVAAASAYRPCRSTPTPSRYTATAAPCSPRCQKLSSNASRTSTKAGSRRPPIGASRSGLRKRSVMVGPGGAGDDAGSSFSLALV